MDFQWCINDIRDFERMLLKYPEDIVQLKDAIISLAQSLKERYPRREIPADVKAIIRKFKTLPAV